MNADPSKTQRDLDDVVAELRAVGFEDAKEIGRGGFGAVYRCTQHALDRAVAVKVLTADLNENRERFFREQRAMGRLTGHPNIVAVLEVGELPGGRPYLVTPYHSFGSLDARIRRDGPLTVDEVLHLGVKMAGALESAHRAEVLHRDVKPANILLTDYGEPALTDFGIARIAGGFRTTTGAVTGSPAFIAPEVLAGDPPSRASDVYGLGATLFCALTGHAAFERRSGEQLVAQFLRLSTQPVPDLRESGMPGDVCAVIEGAMSPDPGERPLAAEIGEKLQGIQQAHGREVDQMALRTGSGGERMSLAVAVQLPRIHVSGMDRAGAAVGAGMLPQELTSFVDRRSQLSTAKNLLSRSPLVTLTGIGGVGKSRLALQVAHKVRQNFEGGVRFVELVELRDSLLLVDVVAAAFDVRPRVGRTILEVLMDFLSTRKVLLVLDNCEQVIDAVAALAESLLQYCPGLRILVTSRESVGIGGEAVLPVPPLRFPQSQSTPSLRESAGYDAMTLFAERASAAVPGFQVTENNRASVAGICERLDGLPLAIELAAARLRTMSTEQVLARLTDRFALLTHGNRGAPTRQQTLEWCIDWSYDLCTPTEQRLWDRLSVFAGGVDLEAAEYVCGRDMTASDFLDALTALVDKSILIREESDRTVRFRVLETVQEYGAQKLKESGAYSELCRQHRDWYERLASEAETDWVSPRQLEWIARIRRELPNLRKAMEFSRSESNAAGLRTASALFSFWFSTGRLHEGHRWCERTLAGVSDAAADRAKTLCLSSVLASQLGDLATATTEVAELRLLAERTGDATIGSLLALAEGCTDLNSGDPAHASVRLNDAVEAFSARSDLLLELRASAILGWAYVLQGDTASAVACLDQILAVARSHGDTMYRAIALRPLAFAEWQHGERERAMQLLEEALKLASQIADPVVAAFALEVLAWITAETRNARRAATLLGAAHVLSHAVGPGIMFPQMASYHQECERRTREVLGGREFESAHHKGSAMSLESAIDFGLGERHRTDAVTEPGAAQLTKREIQVAELIAEGLSNKAIATRLVISQRTAEGHVEHLLSKLGFTSRAQVAVWAAEHARD